MVPWHYNLALRCRSKALCLWLGDLPVGVVGGGKALGNEVHQEELTQWTKKKIAFNFKQNVSMFLFH